jgi:uncharacterized protein YwgA
MSTFGSRIKLQKLVYILKSLGIHFGYDFTWYIYGPYSPDLTRDGYLFNRNKIQINVLIESSLMSENERETLHKINRKIINNSDNAELIASYLYLKEKYGPRAQEELMI